MWWALACVALGAIYAWLLYSRAGSLSANMRYLLAAARFMVVTVIAFLLLSPMIKTVSSRAQKALVLVVQVSHFPSTSLNPKPSTQPKWLMTWPALKNRSAMITTCASFHFPLILKIV